MEKAVYPLLCYDLPNGHILVLMVGLPHRIVERSLKLAKAALTELMQRRYRKEGDYDAVDLTDYRLKILEVSIRPMYRSDTRSYPLTEVLALPVPLVYGSTAGLYGEEGELVCHLPTIDDSFYFHKEVPEQLENLARYFITEHYMSEEPSILYASMGLPLPRLEELTIRFAARKRRRGSAAGGVFSEDWAEQSAVAYLKTVAEPYPYEVSAKRVFSPYPDVAWEMEDYVNRVAGSVVLRNNVLVVSASGGGKTAVLRQVAKRLAGKRGQGGRTSWQILAQRVVANARYLGEWQRNAEKLFSQVKQSDGILWALDLVQLLQAGGDGPEDSLAAFMQPYLQNGQIQVMGEATKEQLESLRRLLPAFLDCFQVVELPELSEKQVHQILGHYADYVKQQQQIDLQLEARELAYRLLKRYEPYERFPGKGLRFFVQLMQDLHLKAGAVVGREEVLAQFTRQTGLPPLLIRDEMLLDTGALRDFFRSRIMGQEAAIGLLEGLVKIFKAGLNNPNKPIATLLFTGPTGVGKTACAKALADYFFGMGQKRSPLVRIDMSEFQHPSQLSRFIGSGRETGKLIQEIRERPFSVLLLDEIEKAHPSVFDVLLGLLDEGLLKDHYGRITHFRNTIVIMTSNLGASQQGALGFGERDLGLTAGDYEAAVSKFFRPEFVNRMDYIVPFNRLQLDDLRAIIQKELAELNRREGLLKRGLRLVAAETLVEYLLKRGFDQRYGARPLQRALDTELIVPLSEWLLKRPELVNCILRLDWREGRLHIDSSLV